MTQIQNVPETGALDMQVPNLDHMSEEELTQVFINFSNLAEYTLNKKRAMQARKAGLIQEAIHREDRCDQIYKHLPKGWRW